MKDLSKYRMAGLVLTILALVGCVTTRPEQPVQTAESARSPATSEIKSTSPAFGLDAQGGEIWDSHMRPNPHRSSYQHDRWVTLPREIVRPFEAFVVSFDSKTDDGAAWGIPDWVAYEMQKYPGKVPKGPERPSVWMTDEVLAGQGVAPTDATYHYSAAFLAGNPNWFERGHLCMKAHAWRLGANADWNSHNVMNAVPQRGNFNRGIWQELEDLTAEWADEFTRVWVIAGPVVEGRRPKAYLGESQKREMLIVIPDAIFKIVVKESGGATPDVLAFRFPQEHPKYAAKKPRDLAFFLVSVDSIEAETGLDFLTALPDDVENAVEREKAPRLWPKKAVIAGRN